LNRYINKVIHYSMNKQRARTIDEKEYRKEQLKKAALQLFAQNGFRNTTVATITQKANLSPAAFYLYFKNKITLYRTLNKDGINILESLLRQALEKHKSCADTLLALAHAYYTFFKDYRDYFYITEILHLGNDDFFYDATMVKELEERTIQLLQIVADVIKEGIKKNEFKKVNPFKAAVSLWGMIDGVLILEVKKSTSFTGFGVEVLINQMIELVLNGLVRKR